MCPAVTGGLRPNLTIIGDRVCATVSEIDFMRKRIRERSRRPFSVDAVQIRGEPEDVVRPPQGEGEVEPTPVLGQSPQLFLWPDKINANGMFIASWTKKK